MHTRTAKCKIGTVERTARDVMVQKQGKTGLAFVVTITVTGLWLLGKSVVYQIFRRRIVLFCFTL